VWRDFFICVAWLIDMCGVTHLYVWHDSLICVTWLFHMCGVTHWYVWRDSFICVTWLVDMCDVHMNEWVTHSYEWHESSLICVSHIVWCEQSGHSCEWVTHSYECAHQTYQLIWMSDSFIWVTWNHSYECPASLVCATCHTYERVMSHIWISHVTRKIESCHTHK